MNNTLQEAINENMKDEKEFIESLNPVTVIADMCFLCEQVNPEAGCMCDKCPVKKIMEGCKVNKYFGTVEAL